MIKGKMNIVIGVQAGSEAKGKLSGYLVDKFNPDIIAGCLAPNAGHTIIHDGNKYVSHHIPVCSVMSNCKIVMGPASVINVVKFVEELDRLGINRRRLLIDPRAAIITPKMIAMEKESITSIGSTTQGVGEARSAKLMRSANAMFFGDLSDRWLKHIGISRDQIIDTSAYLNQCLSSRLTVLYEMSQGFDLCLEHGIDRRYCTSRVINPAAAFAESGVNLKYMGHVYGVLRPYPIRVNNRTGYSGPYADAKEITWEEIAKRCGAPEGVDLTEITTTTKLPRRVFEFSWERFRKFVQICNPDYLCLQFANYLEWGCYKRRNIDELSSSILSHIRNLSITKIPVAYIGTGPDHLDMVDMDMDENNG